MIYVMSTGRPLGIMPARRARSRMRQRSGTLGADWTTGTNNDILNVVGGWAGDAQDLFWNVATGKPTQAQIDQGANNAADSLQACNPSSYWYDPTLCAKNRAAAVRVANAVVTIDGGTAGDSISKWVPWAIGGGVALLLWLVVK